MYICMRFKKTKLLLKSSTSKILSMAMKKERLWKKLSKLLEVAPEFYNTMEWKTLIKSSSSQINFYYIFLEFKDKFNS